jgi:hypothetical protein
VVLSKLKIEDLEAQCSREPVRDVESLWMPSSEDLQRLEADLPRLQGQTSQLFCLANTPLPDPAKYDRQYVGVIIGGKRWVYVNAFTQVADLLWANGLDPNRDLIHVCGGGEEHWSVLYDPSARLFTQLAINCAR